MSRKVHWIGSWVSCRGRLQRNWEYARLRESVTCEACLRLIESRKVRAKRKVKR